MLNRGSRLRLFDVKNATRKDDGKSVFVVALNLAQAKDIAVSAGYALYPDQAHPVDCTDRALEVERLCSGSFLANVLTGPCVGLLSQLPYCPKPKSDELQSDAA